MSLRGGKDGPSAGRKESPLDTGLGMQCSLGFDPRIRVLDPLCCRQLLCSCVSTTVFKN